MKLKIQLFQALTGMSRLMKKFSGNFNLNGATPVYFWKSEWERFDPSSFNLDQLQQPSGRSGSSISLAYIAYRFLFAIFFLTLFIQNWICDSYLYFIYLTNLSSLLQFTYGAFYFFILLALKLYSYMRWPELDPETEQSQRLLGRRSSGAEEDVCGSDGKYRRLPLVYKLIWILVNITCTIPFGVSAVYWLAIYDGPGPSSCENVFNYFLHAANSTMALIDVCVIAIPIRISHMVFPFLTGLGYILFTILYEIVSGVYKDSDEFVYSILNWRNAPLKAALVSLLVLLAACGIHTIFCWGLSKLRVYVVRKFFT